MDDATSSDTKNTHFQDSEEEEEALSLSGLVSNSDDAESIVRDDDDPHNRCQDVSRSSSSEPSDFFEFFSELGSEMSHAEDIIFCGKLIPFKEQINNQHNHDHIHKLQTPRDDKLQSFRRRRCESMSEAIIASNGSTKTKLRRHSRSMDSQKLYGSSNLRSEKMEIERSLSSKSSGMKEKAPLIPRSRWYYLTFGLVKIPPEMALQDIKSRRIRRNPGTLFSSFHDEEKGNINRDDRRNSSWDLLRVLSCKDDESVAVTASFSRPQHA